MTFKTADELEKIARNYDLYIVGAGNRGNVINNFFEKRDISTKGIVDKKKQMVPGKKIISYADIDISDDILYLLSSRDYKQSMYETLVKCGVKEDNILEGNEDDLWFSEIFETVFDVPKYTSNILSFKDKYKGKRCFLIGNGPSLSITDLEQLKGDISFGCNSIYALYPKTSWRPDFFVVNDGMFANYIRDDDNKLNLILDNCKYLFSSVTVGLFLKYRDSEDKRFVFFRRRYSNENKLLFSAECDKGVVYSDTVMGTMLSLAMYMGFSDIYLLGVDFTFSSEHYASGKIENNSVNNHQIDIEQENRHILRKSNSSYYALMDSQMSLYQNAKSYADLYDIHVFNATRGGKLEVFPRVDFNSLF